MSALSPRATCLFNLALMLLLVAHAVGCNGRTTNTESESKPRRDHASKASQGPSFAGSERTSKEPNRQTGRSPSANTDQDNFSRFQFRDIAKESGLVFAYQNGEAGNQFSILENLGGGIALLDFNNDGWLDVLCAGGGTIDSNENISGLPFGLYANQDAAFNNVTQWASFSGVPRYSHGLTVLDYNNDGFADVLATGYGGASLLLNQGDGTFSDVASKALAKVSGIATSAAAADFNGDGTSDLYICTYVDWSFDGKHPFCPAPDGTKRELCSPKEFDGTSDFLFYGDGQGGFDYANSIAGLSPGGKGLGVLACDFDGDGDNDIYVANDTTENFLYVNDGKGQFKESGLLQGVALDERALPNGSMGLTACDVNRDLRLDIWVANYERESFALYRNEGGGTFLHTSRRFGIAALGGKFVGFGTDWEDFDSDGEEEIVVTNGHVLRYPTGAPRRQTPLLLAKEEGRFTIEQFPADSYFHGKYEGRGLAVGDLNNDGKSDIVVGHINENVAILENETRPRGHSLTIRLIGRVSTRFAEGARLVLSTSAGKSLRTLVGGGSYLSHNESAVRFGVPHGEEARSLEVHWPSGHVQNVTLSDQRELVLLEPLAE